MDNLEEKKLKSNVIYKGKIFTVTKDEALLSNGLLKQRDVVNHSGGVVILAEKKNKIIFVQQFRYPTGQVLYELPAGKLDKKGEQIEEAAKRELEEETGFIANKWTDMGFIFSSPGFCTEKLHLFKASDLSFVGQKPDEGEIINFIEIEKEKAFEMIKSGEIVDAKTICLLMKAYCL